MIRICQILAVVAILFVVLSSLFAFPYLPEQIPVHWNIRGDVDGYGPRAFVFLTPAIMVPLSLMMWALPWLSPRNYQMDEFVTTYWYVMAGIAGLFAYIHGLLLLAYLGITVQITTALMVGIFLAFAAFGKVLGRVRKNFFIGVRTPWTLASDRVWNDTHRLTARLFTWAGVLGAVLSLLPIPRWIPLILMVPVVVLPVVHSLVHYKRLERRGEV